MNSKAIQQKYVQYSRTIANQRVNTISKSPYNTAYITNKYNYTVTSLSLHKHDYISTHIQYYIITYTYIAIYSVQSLYMYKQIKNHMNSCYIIGHPRVRLNSPQSLRGN